MSRPKNPVPTYRKHSQSGQAIATVNVSGVRKDLLLGVHGSPESQEGPGSRGQWLRGE